VSIHAERGSFARPRGVAASNGARSFSSGHRVVDSDVIGERFAVRERPPA
jgi:hypothetical protein